MGLRPIRDLLRYEPQSRALLRRARPVLARDRRRLRGAARPRVRAARVAVGDQPRAARRLPAVDVPRPDLRRGRRSLVAPLVRRARRRRARARLRLARVLRRLRGHGRASRCSPASGTGLFRPAVMAGLPSLVSPAGLPAATSLYGALADIGFTLGPALAGVGLLLASAGDRDARERPQLRRLGASCYARAARRRRPPRASRASLVREARAGVRAVARMPGLRAVIAGSSAVVLFAGLFNVGELLLAEEELGAGDAGLRAARRASFGLGVVAGSLAGAGSSEPLVLKRRYLAGIARHRRGLPRGRGRPGHRARGGRVRRRRLRQRARARARAAARPGDRAATTCSAASSGCATRSTRGRGRSRSRPPGCCS